MLSSSPAILQVCELNRKAKFILESEFRAVWLIGEISNLVKASSGHWYFSLKDDKAQVKSAMFRGHNRLVNLQPANGMQVLVRANVSLYEPRGDFQLIVEHMEDAGIGLLKQQFEQLKQRLANQGLFALEHKKPLPKFVQTIGVITSATGAAIRDIISVIQRRHAGIRLIVYPTAVQGSEAAGQIAQQIQVANQRNECDVLIVGRGGGSLEDLWPFNEEVVVRAIFASQLPVVSAVGHEIDHSLADLVADVRAATPTAAAELLSADSEQLLQTISSWQKRLVVLQSERIKQKRQYLASLVHRLQQRDPQKQIQMQQQKCDELILRLNRAIKAKLQQAKHRHQLPHQQLAVLPIKQRLHAASEQLNKLDHQLMQAIRVQYANKQKQLQSLAYQLHLVSPLATIARGFTITRDQSGNIIRNIEAVKIGDTVQTQLQSGVLISEVKACKPSA